MPMVKTSEVTGTALDWLVAKCQGWEGVICKNPTWSVPLYIATNDTGLHTFSPSTDWAQGGPIVESIKGFMLKQWLESKPESCCEVHIHNYNGDWIQFGTTPLIAAMRCYVASKFGDEVEIPEELMVI